ncbi:CotH kinase family protein [Parabacteroides sp. OttesenSCG-928-J18]|nr:CotH kinase family protein [Parabacteroides sp. OttesenSCG-928-J18]
MKKGNYSFSLFLFCLLLFKTATVFATEEPSTEDPLYPFHPSAIVELTSSNLPIVMIDLDERMADKSADKRVSASMKIIWHEDGQENRIEDTEHFNYDGKVGIKYRGNSSYLLSDKKPFALRIQDENEKKKKASILGMGEDEDWALLAPYSDRTLFRDVLVFELMRGTMEYVPTGKHCELILNGIYQGVYIMAARVRQGPHRININAPTTDSGDGLTGGYHLEIDRMDDPGFFGEVSPCDLWGNPIGRMTYFQYKYPDEEDLSSAQKSYIQSQVKRMENATAGIHFKDPTKGFRAYIDEVSAYDYIIAQEFTKNSDAYRLSTPIYKYPNSIDPRFKFSIWDFNISMGNNLNNQTWGTDGWVFNNNRFETESCLVPWFFKRMLQDEDFQEGLRERWAMFRQTRLSDENISNCIDSLTCLLTEAQERNFTAWDRWGRYVWPNYFIPDSWEDELGFLNEWLMRRVNWIDSQWLEAKPNLLPNGGFESSLIKKPNRPDLIWLSEWTDNDSIAKLTRETAIEGEFSLLMKGKGSISQIITELEPDEYKLYAWVRTSPETEAKMYLKYVNDNKEEVILEVPIQSGKNYWHEVAIDSLYLDRKTIEVGFVNEGESEDAKLWIDDASFMRKDQATSRQRINTAEPSFSVYMDKTTQKITVQLTEKDSRKLLELFDITGKTIYTAPIKGMTMVIEKAITPNQVYIIRIGDSSQKVIL